MSQSNSGSRSLGLVGGLLAFVLSAIMGVAFVMVVNKTHDLFSSAVFEDGVPNVAAVLGWQEQTVVGTWQGKWHDIPSVTVTIGREGDQLTGSVIFQEVLKTQNGPGLAGVSVTVPLKDASFDGKTLRFKLDDSRAARDLRELGLEMTLISANQAELILAACKDSGAWSKWDCEEVVMTKTA